MSISQCVIWLASWDHHEKCEANSADGLPVADPDYGSSNPFLVTVQMFMAGKPGPPVTYTPQK